MKYIIEIAKEYEEYFKGILICGIAEGKFAVDVIAKEDLEELNSDYINEHFGSLQDEAYKRGINDGSLDVKQRVEGAYQRGFEDGKAVHDKGCEGCMYQDNTIEHHPCGVCRNAYNNRWTAKDDKIEVGDEVIYNGTTKCIVVRPEDDERYASLIDSDGTHHSADHRECEKTGRHFDIASILEDMRHD